MRVLSACALWELLRGLFSRAPTHFNLALVGEQINLALNVHVNARRSARMYAGTKESAFVCVATWQYIIRAADSYGPRWPMSPLLFWKAARACVIDLGGLGLGQEFYNATPGHDQFSRWQDAVPPSHKSRDNWRFASLPHGRRLWAWFLTVPSCWCPAGLKVHGLHRWPGVGFTDQVFWRLLERMLRRLCSCNCELHIDCEVFTRSMIHPINVLFAEYASSKKNLFDDAFTRFPAFSKSHVRLRSCGKRENVVLCSIWFHSSLPKCVPHQILNKQCLNWFIHSSLIFFSCHVSSSAPAAVDFYPLVICSNSRCECWEKKSKNLKSSSWRKYIVVL